MKDLADKQEPLTTTPEVVKEEDIKIGFKSTKLPKDITKGLNTISAKEGTAKHAAQKQMMKRQMTMDLG